MSLKWKIAISMWIVAAVSTLVAIFLSSWLLIRSQEELVEQRLRSTAGTLMSLGISDYHGLKGFEELDSFIESSLKLTQVNKVINIFTRRGKLMFSTVVTTVPDFEQVFSPYDKPTIEEHVVSHRKFKIFTTSYLGKNKKEYFLQIAAPCPEFTTVLKSNMDKALYLFLALSVLSFLISQLLSKRIVRPVRDVSLYLQSLNPSQIKEWKPLFLGKKAMHLKEIEHGINLLVTRVKSAIYGLSKTSRYLAHEIRNPLTIITGEAESVLMNQQASKEEYQEVVQSALEEAERIHGVIETISRITEKERLVYKPSPLNLNVMFSRELPRWESLLGRKIQYDVSDSDMIVLLDELMIIRLVDNLIRNIKKHTHRKAKCGVSLSKKDGVVVLCTWDEGAGMPIDFMNQLNNKNMDHEMLGIGLMLVHEIASICELQLSFQKYKEHGLEVKISIPA